MPITNFIIIICWIVFICYWAVSAFRVKKDVGRSARWFHFLLIRAFLVVVAFWLILTGADSLRVLAIRPSTPAAGIVGAVLCVAGVAFAIWARYHLGSNWSGVPSIKEGHELVTSGPYRFVRHPIYTGILAAIFGSALAGVAFWFIVFAIAAVVFVLRIKKEEGFMMQLFGERYAVYRARTKALIPGVW